MSTETSGSLLMVRRKDRLVGRTAYCCRCQWKDLSVVSWPYNGPVEQVESSAIRHTAQTGHETFVSIEVSTEYIMVEADESAVDVTDKIHMSPLQIEILLFYFTRGCDHPCVVEHSESGQESLQRFLSEGYLTKTNDPKSEMKYLPTKKLKDYCSMICRIKD